MSTAYFNAISGDNPTHAYMLDEGGGSVAHDLAGSSNWTYSNGSWGLPLVKSASAAWVSSGSATDFVGWSAGAGSGFFPNGAAGFPWSIELWVQVSGSDTGTIYGGRSGGGHNSITSIECNGGTGFVALSIRNQAGGGGSFPASSTKINGGGLFYLTYTMDASGNSGIYVNGNATPAVTSTGFSGSLFVSEGDLFSVSTDELNNTAVAGSYQGLAFYAYALSTAQIANHYAAGFLLPTGQITQQLEPLNASRSFM